MEDSKLELGHGHQKRDDAVFKFFKETMEDIGSAFLTDPEHRNYTSERVQLICVFTFIDVLASYWYEYLGLNGTQQERFVAWAERYCLAEKNPEYLGTDFGNLTVANFYALRCSMVHFFGIAGLEGDHVLSIATNRVSDDLLEQWRKDFRARGHQVLIFKPKKLYDLVLEGALVMLDEWKQVIDESQSDETIKWQYIEGINRIYQKIQLEGAALVVVPDKK
jgi:hypothetical protein